MVLDIGRHSGVPCGGELVQPVPQGIRPQGWEQLDAVDLEAELNRVPMLKSLASRKVEGVVFSRTFREIPREVGRERVVPDQSMETFLFGPQNAK